MNNKQVAHAWAHQEKQSAKGSHFFFEGPTIYSYGYHFPIATLHNGGVLFTLRDYSNTTAKHINHVSRAIPSDWRTVYCWDIIEASKGIHDGNFGQWIIEAENVLKALSKAKKPSKYLAQLAGVETQVAAYCEFLGVSAPSYLLQRFEILTTQGEALADALRKENEQARKAEAKKIEQAKEQLEKWLKGKTNSAPHYRKYDLLRVSRSESIAGADLVIIQTTGGLSFTMEECQMLHRALKSGHAPSEFKHYRIIQKGKELHIGCHRFELAYLIEFGNKLFQ